MAESLIIRELQQSNYQPTWQAMRHFTDERDEDTPDEIWLLEHQPVFTQGQAGKAEHILDPKGIPVVHTDRGGQVTYHGPGQLMLYCLLDLHRLHIGVRQMVRKLEQTVIDVLAEYKITAQGRCDAPGVYVDDAKICSIGLRVRKGCSYHGIAFNVNMDVKPFQSINPCGFKNLAITQVADFVPNVTIALIKAKIIPAFLTNFGYTAHTLQTDYPLELVDGYASL